MKLVVDASILIDHLRKGYKWNQLIDETDRKTDIEFFIPSIVLFELFSGESTRKQFAVNKIYDLTHSLKRIDLTESIAKKAGEIYRDIDKYLDVPDYIIAASAFEINGAVVTLNTKHFQKIPNLNLFPL